MGGLADSLDLDGLTVSWLCFERSGVFGLPDLPWLNLEELGFR